MAFKSEQFPLVSIIIHLHNHETVIGSAIESCLRQAYPNVEIIVVDDCSSDTSVEIAQKYEPYVRIIRIPHRLGLGIVRNIGLSHAIGEFVLFHESDDLLFPDRLCHDIDIISHNPRTDIVVSINRWFRDGETIAYNPEPNCRRERRLLRHISCVTGKTEQSIIGMLRYGGPQQSCVLYKASIVRALGGYFDELESYADRDLLFRALCRGATVVMNPRVTAAWRVHNCIDRIEPLLRKDDQTLRLILAARYAIALDQAGLLRHEQVMSNLITHIIGQVYQYAEYRKCPEIAGAALNLVSVLRNFNENKLSVNRNKMTDDTFKVNVDFHKSLFQVDYGV